MIRVLLVDTHDYIEDQLVGLGFSVDHAFDLAKEEVQSIISDYQGLIIRSRFSIDRFFIDHASQLQFIARIGAGLENIDTAYAQVKNITVIAAPEGNCDAVAEHNVGILLALMNRITVADRQVRQGQWIREGNRGTEIMGKTIGIIGYGNMGKAFARRLKGFSCTVICYDIKENVGDIYAQQVPLKELFDRTDILSLHVNQTPETLGLINVTFINAFRKNIYILNTARGKSLIIKDLVTSLQNRKVLGAALDVLEYEKASFEKIFVNEQLPEFRYLLETNNVVLTPHIAGWTHESKKKLAQAIINKLKVLYQL